MTPPTADRGRGERLAPAQAFAPALDAILQHALRPVAAGLAILYLLLAASRFAALRGATWRRPDAATILTVEQILVAAGMLAIAWALPRTPARRAHVFLFVMAVAIAIDSALHMYLIDRTSESITFVLAILGLAFVSTSLRWHTATLATLLAAWVVGVAIAISSPMAIVDEMGMFVLIAAALSVILFAARRGTLLRLEGLRQEANDLNENLMRANRELDAFAHRISHDLNTPLTTLKLQLHILKGDGGQPRPELVKIERATQTMQELVSDLLWLSRADSRPLRLAEVDVTLMARQIVATLEAAHPDRRVLTLIDDDIRVHADAGLLRIVLLNLLQNAWKFTSRERSPVVEVQRVGRPQCTDGFRVRDNGAGFRPSEAGRIFEAFQRLHSTKQFPGSGIGLATVHRIIERHGGTITASAQPNRGAAFTVTLPRPGDDRAQSGAASSPGQEEASS